SKRTNHFVILVALRSKPPEFYISQIKSFTKLFIDQLEDQPQPCSRDLTWNSGALHYSDDIELVSGLVDLKEKRSELKAAIDRISYIGKGTYTDCAIKEGIAELIKAGSHYHENKYIVVVTDGHPLTGYKEPCGGIQEATNEARQHAIKVFAVAISPDQEDTRLSIIATDINYRQNFTAADSTRSSHSTTIDTIIGMIVSVVTQTHHNKDVHMIVLWIYGGIKGAPGDRGLMGERGEDGPPGNGTVGCHGFQGYPGPRGDPGSPVKCKCGPLDIAFIVDSSESIGATNFALAKDFIVTLMDRLKLRQFGANESRIGVVQYSGPNAQEVVKLGDPNITTLTDLKQAVKELRWLAEATYTGEALQYSLNNLINKLVTDKSVIIVLTDGRSDTIRDDVPVDVLCGKGLKVGGVGVVDYAERKANREQVNQVMCEADPRKGFSFVLDNFGLLLDDSFLQNLTKEICKEKKCPNYTCPLAFNNDTDILIMMDSSASVGKENFELTKDFTKMLAERFLTEGGEKFQITVGVGQYSNDANMEAEFDFDPDKVVARIAEAKYQGGGTNIKTALDYAIGRLRTGRGLNKKLLVFSDGRSQGVDNNDIENVVKRVSNAGIELFVLSVRNHVNETHLRTLVSRGLSYDYTYANNHLFKRADYHSLLTGVFYQSVSRKISLG
uniref:Collagen, type VI, alpha 1 n=1 Tax=Cyprinus carpio carpio TaxID=630221 RepID=A0A9J8A2Q4_CYPCA